jgi:hypothetical protein
MVDAPGYVFYENDDILVIVSAGINIKTVPYKPNHDESNPKNWTILFQVLTENTANISLAEMVDALEYFIIIC